MSLNDPAEIDAFRKKAGLPPIDRTKTVKPPVKFTPPSKPVVQNKPAIHPPSDHAKIIPKQDPEAAIKDRLRNKFGLTGRKPFSSATQVNQLAKKKSELGLEETEEI